MLQESRVDIVFGKRLVGWNEECVVGTHSQQVGIEVEVQVQRCASITVLDGGVHHLHVAGKQCGSRYGNVTVRCKDGVQHIGNAVVGNLHIVGAVLVLVDDLRRQAHRVGSIVHHVAELTGNSTDE